MFDRQFFCDRPVRRRGLIAPSWCARLLLLLLLTAVPRILPAQEEDDEPATPGKSFLLTESFPGTTWKHFSGKRDAPLGETWKVQPNPSGEGVVLVCLGDPYGYVKTSEEYQNFELGLEWKYPSDENGNSGILLFVHGEDRIWPTAIQVQLHQPVAGSTFPAGEARSDNELRTVPTLARPVNQWNECTVFVVNGRVEVSLNGKKVGAVTGCEPQRGAVALQSEGSEIHFRNLWIRALPDEMPAEPREATAQPVRENNQDRRSSSLPVKGMSVFPTEAYGGVIPLGPSQLGIPVRYASPVVWEFECPKRKRAKRKPLGMACSGGQGARGQRKLRAEWVRLQSEPCECRESMPSSQGFHWGQLSN